MKSNLRNKIQAYFEYTSEIYGEELLLDRAVNLKQDNNQTKTVKTESIRPYKAAESTKENISVKTSLSIIPNWNESENITILKDRISNCIECPLGVTRKNFVFGTGNPDADIMVIGEAPGADEDEQGKPFVGRAGQLLTKILESVNLSRDEVFIANIIKCRPPNNRRPVKEEVDKCEPYLKKQIELIKPAFILSLGLTSVDTLLKKTHKMSEIRGKIMDYYNIKNDYYISSSGTFAESGVEKVCLG